jgi:DNA-binding beta-propeller fold protein YncE
MSGFANGIGVAASFWAPRGLALSANGARLFVADALNNRVRAVDTATGAVTTLAGSGASLPLDAAVGADAGLCGPESLAVVTDGSAGSSRETLVVGDRCSGRLRRIDTATGAVTTIAGASSVGYFANGVGTNVAFADLVSVAADARGNLFVVDGGIGSGGGGRSSSGSTNVDSAAQSRRMRYRLVQSASPCPAGSVCGAAVSRPASCPAGAFCGATGLSAISGAGTGACTVAGLGLNSCAGSGVCPIGAYCASGSVAPAACPLGAVCATTGMSAPALCRAGAYCNATGLRHVPCES